MNITNFGAACAVALDVVDKGGRVATLGSDSGKAKGVINRHIVCRPVLVGNLGGIYRDRADFVCAKVRIGIEGVILWAAANNCAMGSTAGTRDVKPGASHGHIFAKVDRDVGT